MSSYWYSCCFNCCNCILGIQLRFQYHSLCPVIFLSFFLLSLFLSSVGIVYFHFSQSLGTCMFSLIQPLVLLCSCQVLNFPSELIFLLLYSHCTLVKSKFHMDIFTVSYVCFWNSSSVSPVTFKPYMCSHCNIFIFVICHSYLVFNLFIWSLRGIMLIQSNSYDNESPWNFPHFPYRHVCKISKSDYLLQHVCLSVHPSVCMKQHGSHWMYFHENFYLSSFQKSVKKIFH